MCLNFDCVKGWRKRRPGDPWWDAYLEERVAEPANAPPVATMSEGRKRDVVVDDQTGESRVRWIELGRERADVAAVLAGGGWHVQHAGTSGTPDGRPITGLTDVAFIEEYARNRLDGTFEDALISLQRKGPVPRNLREIRTETEQVIAELVNERNANTNAVKDVFNCSRRLVQEIAKRARQESCA